MTNRLRQAAILAAVIPFALAATLGWRWHAYVTNTASPYDEVGIDLNTYVPRAMNRWGCGRLMATFPRAIPPYGCAAPSGLRWRADLTPA